MEIKLIPLEEYEEKIILVTREEWEYFDKNSKFYFCSDIRDIPPNKKEISIQARFYIGLIRICPTIELIIKPKIKAANFIAMLEYVDKKRINTWKQFIENIEREPNFIDFFIGLFLKEVHELLSLERKRGYNLMIENRNSPKGKILMSNTFKSGGPLNNQISCQYFVLSLNTPHNQIIKYTLNYIRRLISNENFSIYRQNLAILKNVDYLKWNSTDIEHVTYNRLTYNYKPIHDFCRLILDDFSLKFEEGKEKFFAFVINSWNVYEIFLREIYKKFQSDFRVDAYKIGGLTDDTDWDEKDARPDIVLKKGEEDKIYIDAKYKMEKKDNDYYQMNYYLTQSPKKLPYGELIYPKNRNEQKDHIEKKSKREKVRIRYIDLTQVNDINYLKDFISETYKKYKKVLSRYNP
ncbi:MAG: McrC family protein [Candidatus Thorarchaeota archaeon]